MPKLYDLLVTALCPVGTVVAYAGSTAPRGWLICNGQTFSASDYPKLAAVLGGNTVPDLRNKSVVGVGNMALNTTSSTGVNSSGAFTSGSHAITVNEMPSHTHAIKKQVDNNSGNSIAVGSGSSGLFYQRDNSVTTVATGGGAGHTHTITAPVTALNYIIRCGGGQLVRMLDSLWPNSMVICYA